METGMKLVITHRERIWLGKVSRRHKNGMKGGSYLENLKLLRKVNFDLLRLNEVDNFCFCWNKG